MEEKEKRRAECGAKNREEEEKRARAVEIQDDSMKQLAEKRNQGKSKFNLPFIELRKGQFVCGGHFLAHGQPSGNTFKLVSNGHRQCLTTLSL